MAIIDKTKPSVIIIPTKDILSTVPQYLQRFALELTILPQVRHFISFTLLLKKISVCLYKYNPIIPTLPFSV